MPPSLAHAVPSPNSPSPPVVGMSFEDMERYVELATARAPSVCSADLSGIAQVAVDEGRFSIRTYLTEHQGSGYWEFTQVSPRLYVSVTDATYLEPTWIKVPQDRMFKIRILLAGKIINKTSNEAFTGICSQIYLNPGREQSGYFIEPGEATKLVILHCRPELLTEDISLPETSVPAPLDAFFCERDGGSLGRRVGTSPEVFRAASDIVNSRNSYINPIRRTYLEAKCNEILCAVLQSLVAESNEPHLSVRLSRREFNRLHEARDILTQHFRKPPPIPRLARMVSLNQTKLKAAFKEIFGMTIYEFVQKCRMERASGLLLAKDLTISEVAYEVGYDYPANFTHAFKKHFECLPRDMRR